MLYEICQIMLNESCQLIKEVWSPYNGFKEKDETLKRKMEELTSQQEDVLAEIEGEELRSSKRRKRQVDNWLSNVKKRKHEFEYYVQQVEQNCRLWRIFWYNRAAKILTKVEDQLEQHSKLSDQGFFLNVNEKKGKPLGTTELEGERFRKNREVVLGYGPDVSSIGIYGMPGVGKTTLAVHIHDFLLLKETTFAGNVYWVPMSPDFSIPKLQNDIAKTLGLDLSGEDDELRRKNKLSDSLKKKEKFVLILDDVGTHFDVNKVGIPLGTGGGKLIITSRSAEVCRETGCQELFKVNPLTDAESWKLFLETLGHSGVLPTEIEQIAKTMMMKCDGLPLALKTMAASMRRVKDVFAWKDAFEEFKELKMENMNTDVFPVLQCAYNLLRSDKRAQKCFLYCSLYPKNWKIEKGELIRLFILEELLDKRNTRSAKLDQGKTVLQKLERVCLIEIVVNGDDGKKYVRMHDLVREMALKIAKDEFKRMVKKAAQLHKLPGEQESSEDLDNVALLKNDIREISQSSSYVCPWTSLLRGNHSLRLVVDPKQSYCMYLYGKLVILWDLVLTGDNVGMACYDQIEQGGDVNLQPLDTHKLVIWNCDFGVLENHSLDAIPSLIQSKDLKEIQIRGCNLKCLTRLYNCNSRGERTMGYPGLSSTCNSFQSLEKLGLERLEEFTDLCKVGFEEALPPVGTFSHLLYLEVSKCHKMKKLIPRWLLQYLPNLTKIEVTHCKEMDEIITEDEEEQVKQWVSSASLSSNQSKSIKDDEVVLPKLQVLYLEGLPKLKRIYKGRMTCDSIQRIMIKVCPELKRVPLTLPLRNGQPSAPAALVDINMPKESWESLEWDSPDYKDVLDTFIRND